MNNTYMKESIIQSIHNELNSIYTLAENIHESFKSEEELSVSYGFFSGNYIKIGETQEYQKYPIPIVSIEQKGDICFNIDRVGFEFFVTKELLKETIIESLVNNYRVEIYGGKDCLIDFYNEGKPISDVLHDVNNSSEDTIGIAIYSEDFQCNSIKEIFFNVCNLLNI